MFENHRKSLIQDYEWTKVTEICQKSQFGQTVLPDMSFSIRQKIVGKCQVRHFE